MRRQAIDNGKWFDLDTAESFEESRTFDGRNMVSDVTRTQFDHEKLYRTKSGKWILHHWSQWQGSRDSWTEVTDKEAARWLVVCGHKPHKACAAEFAALEV